MPDPPDLPPRLRELIDSLTRRLAGVCAHMPADAFAAMVRRIAEQEYAWERRGAHYQHDPPRDPTDRT